jgi:hypothetical protein
MRAEQGPLWGCDPEGRRGADKVMPKFAITVRRRGRMKAEQGA